MTSPSPIPEDPALQTGLFFDALLAYVPTELHTMLWTLQDKRSTWIELAGGTTAVADVAQQLSTKNRDVYCSVSVSQTTGMYDTRIKSANSRGIMALWADIDIADPDVHKKWNLPPTIEAALDVLDRCGLPPSLVVHSGHGLQAWWLLQEFWSFDTDDDRLAAAGLAQRWNTTLQVRAAEQSYVVDSTFDLARVMRVPGTMNRKQPSKPMPVRIVRYDDQLRYNPEDFEPYVVDADFLAQRGISPTRTYVPDKLDLSDTIGPDFEKFEALRDNDDRFAATWDMKRADFKDQSPSTTT